MIRITDAISMVECSHKRCVKIWILILIVIAWTTPIVWNEYDTAVASKLIFVGLARMQFEILFERIGGCKNAIERDVKIRAKARARA